jgi:hypothetical protein
VLSADGLLLPFCVVVAVETDVQLVENTLNKPVDEAEELIENDKSFMSKFKEYTAEHQQAVMKELNRFFRREELSVAARRQNSVGVFFFCRSLEALHVINELNSSRQLQTILENVFQMVLQTENKVGLRNVSFDKEYESYRTFFRHVKGLMSIYTFLGDKSESIVCHDDQLI